MIYSTMSVIGFKEPSMSKTDIFGLRLKLHDYVYIKKTEQRPSEAL